MAVSKAVVPLLIGEEVESLMRTAKSSKLIPYTEEESKETEKRVAEILESRRKRN